MALVRTVIIGSLLGNRQSKLEGID
jgi:hypothetical protein